MNALELKGGMIEMIAGVQNTDTLHRLYLMIHQIIAETEEADKALTPKQEAVLEQDLLASEQAENLVSHEVALQKMARWLN